MTPLLQGVRVVEVGAVVLGPLAAQILADLGADVIKVEPLSGDVARESHPQGASDGALFVNNNRNKRMLALDLKRSEGRAAFARLVATSDVMLHNMRIEAAERLGLGFEAISAINPRIVHCAAIGFGQRGRYRDRPAFDDIIQAASGLAGLAAQQGGEPQFIPTILADKVAALHIVYAVLAALVARANGREGAIGIEVPMFEAMASFVLNEHLAGATFADDGALGYPRVLAADRRPYRTADGWIAVLPYTGDQWRRFLDEVGRGEICEQAWFADPRVRQTRIDDLYAILAETLPQRSTADWVAALSACDVPCSEINMLEDLLTDPHLAEVGFFDVGQGFPEDIRRSLPQPVEFAGVSPVGNIAPGAVGEHSRMVLRECGHSEAEIDALVAAGVLREDTARRR
ncbi:acyl-CoA transferase/carnitine dehydratase [Sphingopyxis fribergensis]|uniref:Acyl-CoA transferase/carnitine dehydratase n=1 Tax=Sphingopyxis fribergensis TaxID=1515612 RepID=A0A0A7PJ74_9SPHN|nr:CoA transferase [Sphingopyxis fribergensis]AJA10050.1 acyl-CoA transferase/carnitine dehydratase [Sphingopyxis fribergensis]